MKFPLLLSLVALTLVMNGCTTLANRRDLYQPEKAHGKYTDALQQYTGDKIIKTNARPTGHPPEMRPNETPVGY